MRASHCERSDVQKLDVGQQPAAAVNCFLDGIQLLRSRGWRSELNRSRLGARQLCPRPPVVRNLAKEPVRVRRVHSRLEPVVGVGANLAKRQELLESEVIRKAQFDDAVCCGLGLRLVVKAASWKPLGR